MVCRDSQEVQMKDSHGTAQVYRETKTEKNYKHSQNDSTLNAAFKFPFKSIIQFMSVLQNTIHVRHSLHCHADLILYHYKYDGSKEEKDIL